MSFAYLIRRIGVFVLVVFVAVTINFLIPRLRSTNPVEARMNEFAAQGGGQAAANMKQLVAVYNEKFGPVRQVRSARNRVYVDVIEIFAAALSGAQWNLFEQVITTRSRSGKNKGSKEQCARRKPDNY